MKCTLAFSAVIVFGLAACDTMDRPISSGSFDPLQVPGSGANLSAGVSSSFFAGQFVRAAIDNTAFFKSPPKGEAEADKLLGRGTSMKVISTSDSYAKVELDSGEVGYVPTVMLEDPNVVVDAPINPNEFQVYPPVDGYGEPLPPVVPSEQPPEGAIPTVIDPEAPAVTVPPVESAPLPPNDEDIEAGAIPRLEE